MAYRETKPTMLEYASYLRHQGTEQLAPQASRFSPFTKPLP